LAQPIPARGAERVGRPLIFPAAKTKGPVSSAGPCCVAQRIFHQSGTFAASLVLQPVLQTDPTQTEAIKMDELSYVGITFTVVILGLACFMAAKLASKTAYH
jgi:hypothetical protein